MYNITERVLTTRLHSLPNKKIGKYTLPIIPIYSNDKKNIVLWNTIPVLNIILIYEFTLEKKRKRIQSFLLFNTMQWLVILKWFSKLSFVT